MFGASDRLLRDVIMTSGTTSPETGTRKRRGGVGGCRKEREREHLEVSTSVDIERHTHSENALRRRCNGRVPSS